MQVEMTARSSIPKVSFHHQYSCVSSETPEAGSIGPHAGNPSPPRFAQETAPSGPGSHTEMSSHGRLHLEA